MSAVVIRLVIVNKANAILPVPVALDAAGHVEERYLRRDEKYAVNFAEDEFRKVALDPRGYEELIQNGFAAIHLRRDPDAYDPAAIPGVLAFLRKSHRPIYVEILKNDPSLNVAASTPEGDAVPVPNLESTADLRKYLEEWIRKRWESKDTGGTGRSGNVLIKAKWKNRPAFLKVSPDAKGLRSEAASLDGLHALGAGLSVANLFACAEVQDGDQFWMGYLMEPVGKMSLRDYLFDLAPSPTAYLSALTGGLQSLYLKTAQRTSRNFIEDYLSSIQSSLKKTAGDASFHDIQAHFTSQLTINRKSYYGPLRITASLQIEMGRGNTTVTGINPDQDCSVHGDLHFENIRINPDGGLAGAYWLIDPKGFDRGDYVYDIAKLMTSLTGHAHADIGDHGKGNPGLRSTKGSDKGISFNCYLTDLQIKGWKMAMDSVCALAVNVARSMESSGSVQHMKQRLLLVLARHYFSALRYCSTDEAKWLEFARGVQFLNMFQDSLDGKAEKDWDPFIVCAENDWLETR